jgi:tyrosine-specific transport protein
MKKSGSVFGGILLITGSCIGAGMLGLPILTGLSGFFPSSFLFFLAWLFMTTTALLVVEISGWFQRPVNLITMVSHTLGPLGKILCWILYLFLFYALLVAYMSLSGNHTASFSRHLIHVSFPDWVGILFFVMVFGWLIYLGTKQVDHLNRFLMFGKIAAFVLLVFLGVRYMVPKLLFYSKPAYTLFCFPVLIISFGFHNVVPSLIHYLGGDRRRVRQAIMGGSVFAFIVYLIWEVISLGILPSEQIFKGFKMDIDAAQMLQNFLASNLIGYCAQVLAFFAILTSFLAQALSLVHFLRDGFKLPKKEREQIGICALALLPPLLFSIFFPNIFFQALNFAGGICAVVLFGIFPALMTWIGRYQKKNLLPDRVPGGKPLLLFILFIACFIFFYQLTQMLSIPLFPHP